VDVTYRCRCDCLFCFYRGSDKVRKPEDVPLQEVTDKIDTAKRGGLTAVAMVGYGEPSIAETVHDILNYAHGQRMSTSMITTGVTGLHRFKTFYRMGMDHILLSAHGLDGTMDEVLKHKGAFKKQAELMDWLRSEQLPFRTNTVLIQQTYRELPEIADYLIERGTWHFVFLGFLPHYKLPEYLPELAVDPRELRPYIEDAAERLLEAGVYFSIRYHPFCCLAPKYWPYVTNARYVFFDNREWNYPLQVHNVEQLWKDAVACGESVAVQGEPCSSCVARRHCGGWNRTMAANFPGCVQAIREIPEQYQEVWDRDGGMFDLNPVNALGPAIRGN